MDFMGVGMTVLYIPSSRSQPIYGGARNHNLDSVTSNSKVERGAKEERVKQADFVLALSMTYHRLRDSARGTIPDDAVLRRDHHDAILLT
jgi:hypothetical protein